MNDKFSLIVACISLIGTSLCHFVLFSIKKFYFDLEKQTQDNTESIIGCRLEIAALQERTKHI